MAKKRVKAPAAIIGNRMKIKPSNLPKISITARLYQSGETRLQKEEEKKKILRKATWLIRGRSPSKIRLFHNQRNRKDALFYKVLVPRKTAWHPKTRYLWRMLLKKDTWKE